MHMKNFDKLPETITPKQAAELAGVTTNTIRNWCIDFKIGFLVGRRWKVKTESLKKILSGEIHYGAYKEKESKTIKRN